MTARKQNLKARIFIWFARHPDLVQSPVTGSVSLACVALAILLVASPNHLLEPTSIGSILPVWQEIAWALMLGIGGVLAIVGLVVPHRAADCLGTILIAGTLLIDAVAIVAYRGFGAGSITAIILVALAAGLLVRVLVIVWITSILAQTKDAENVA